MDTLIERPSVQARAAILGIGLLLLSACASGSLTVQATSEDRPRVSEIEVVNANATVVVDPEVESTFEEDLREELYSSGRFTEGDELEVAYRFVQLNQGSQWVRYLIGFGAGKGTLTIEVVFRTPDGTEHGKIDVGGEIRGGLFGGDFESAISAAAEQAAKFAINNFAK